MTATNNSLTPTLECGRISLLPLLRRLVVLIVAATATTAWAVPTCAAASSATLSFGSVVALASTGDVTTNSGASFWVNCTSDVTLAPALFSATTRTLVSGGNSLPFALSASSPGGIELATSSPGESLGIARNGANQAVTLYGRIYTGDFKGLPAGSYSRSITLTLQY